MTGPWASLGTAGGRAASPAPPARRQEPSQCDSRSRPRTPPRGRARRRARWMHPGRKEQNFHCLQQQDGLAQRTCEDMLTSPIRRRGTVPGTATQEDRCGTFSKSRACSHVPQRLSRRNKASRPRQWQLLRDGQSGERPACRPTGARAPGHTSRRSAARRGAGTVRAAAWVALRPRRVGNAATCRAAASKGRTRQPGEPVGRQG